MDTVDRPVEGQRFVFADRSCGGEKRLNVDQKQSFTLLV